LLERERERDKAAVDSSVLDVIFPSINQDEFPIRQKEDTCRTPAGK